MTEFATFWAIAWTWVCWMLWSRECPAINPAASVMRHSLAHGGRFYRLFHPNASPEWRGFFRKSAVWLAALGYAPLAALFLYSR